MSNSQSMVADELSAVLDKLFQQFGSWKVLSALASAVWRSWRGDHGQWLFNDSADLSDWMRRDIGLDGRSEGRARPGAPEWERWR